MVAKWFGKLGTVYQSKQSKGQIIVYRPISKQNAALCSTKNQGWMVAKSFRKMRKQSQILTNNDVFPSSCQPYYVVPQYSKAKQTALEQGQYSLLLVRPCIFGPKTRICNRKVAIKNKDVMEQTLYKLDCSFCLIQLLNNKFHIISLWRLCIIFV